MTIKNDTTNLNIYNFLLIADILWLMNVKHKNGSIQLKKHKNIVEKYHI